MIKRLLSSLPVVIFAALAVPTVVLACCYPPPPCKEPVHHQQPPKVTDVQHVLYCDKQSTNNIRPLSTELPNLDIVGADGQFVIGDGSVAQTNESPYAVPASKLTAEEIARSGNHTTVDGKYVLVCSPDTLASKPAKTGMVTDYTNDDLPPAVYAPGGRTMPSSFWVLG